MLLLGGIESRDVLEHEVFCLLSSSLNTPNIFKKSVDFMRKVL